MGKLLTVVLTFTIGSLLALPGCGGGNLASVEEPGEAAPAAPGAGERLAIEGGGSGQPAQCRVSGTLRSEDRPLKLDLALRAEDGVRFVRTGTAALTLPDIALAPNESRDFAEDCYLDTGRGWLPGAYVVRADVTHDQGLNLYATATTHIYVQAGADGHPRVFPGRVEYKQVYEDGYKAGINGIFYQIVLDEGPYPQGGTLYLRVREEIHDFAPAVDIKSVGAFQFRAGHLPEHVSGRLLSNNAVEFALQPIWSGGERILVLPFVLEAGCMGGIYRLEVVKLNGAGGTPLLAEQAPVALKVQAGSGSPGQPWIAEVVRNEAVPIQPTGPLGPVLNKWHRQEGNPAGNNAPTVPAEGGRGGGEMPQQVAPVVPTATPLPPQPTPVPPPTTASAAPQPSGSGWYARSGLRGPLWDIYRAEYRAGGGTLRWVDFQRIVTNKNPQLLADGGTLYPDKLYWLPDPAVE